MTKINGYKINIICAPFDSIKMPSLEVATLKSCFEKSSIEVSVHVLYSEYLKLLGRELYEQLYSTILGDAIFSALLFPDNVAFMKGKLESLIRIINFDEVVQRTREFCIAYVESLCKTIENNDVVYFHMYTKQLFSSAYLAKLISQRKEVRILLGGYHCKGECGKSLLKLFPYIEQVFGEDIEYQLMKYLNVEHFGLYHDLNNFPTPDYSDFQTARQELPNDLKSDYANRFWIQVEYSRGCWWNKCSFCSLNCQYSNFQHKSINNIIRDYETLQKTYKSTQILVTEYNSDDNWSEMVSVLNERFPGLKGTYYLLFKVSALLNEEDYIFISDNDIDILIGVESLSRDNLKLINKGHTVIESIQAIKYAERYRVKCCYNLMCMLPFETEEDFIETSRVISYIMHLIPPFDLEVFRLTHGSAIQRSPEKFGINKMGIRKNVEGILIPDKLQKKYVPFFMDYEAFDLGLSLRESKWRKLIEDWVNKYYEYAKNGRPKLHSLLYTRSSDYVLEIFDSRYTDDCFVYTLFGIERSIYEFCNKIRSFEEITQFFSNTEDKVIKKILQEFIQRKIMFKEEANYLSLAI